MISEYDLKDIKLLAMDYLSERASVAEDVTHSFEQLSMVTLTITNFVKYISEQVEPVPYTLSNTEDKND